MGSLITYSGITTKVKAMERWRIKDEQFQEMASLESVPEAVAYLRKFPPYADIFAGLDEGELHRGMIEEQLNISQYRDFAKLYQFANIKQRRFLDLFFMHYEIGILKTCLRNAAGHRNQRRDLSIFREFFERHSSLDLIAISQSQTMDQFIASLAGSPYYTVLSHLQQKGRVTLPECENALDMVYFRNIWRIKNKYLDKDEQKIIVQCFGTRMDMLNIQWIYRSKKYYHLSPGDIYAILIPINLHLKKAQISRMAEAGSVEEFHSMLENTWYGKNKRVHLDEEQNLEKFAEEFNDRIYQLTSRKEPYSIAVLNSYLYFKEREIGRIITTLESIRYGVKLS